VHCIPQVLQRHDIRDKYHLKGEGAMDCLKAWCCACCDLVQQDKEAAYHVLNNPAGVVSQQPEKQAETMAYGAQPDNSAGYTAPPTQV
jgi:hypothetical protein